MDEILIRVDENDNEIGEVGKMEAHIKGILHRAFSVFIFNDSGELLLQKRSAYKYHSANLWTNTCCGHPRQGESTMQASIRRLEEEMKIVTPLKFILTFQYKSFLKNGLIENEIDHVFYGVTNQLPNADPNEASDWKYIEPKKLLEEVKQNEDDFTSWLKICIDRKIFEEILTNI